MREVEIKLRAPDLREVEKKLKALGCVISEPKTQEDRNFIHRDDVEWFKPTIGGWVYPRLRIQNGNTYILTVKKPVNNEMDCIEHEMRVEDPDALQDIMAMFDYLPGTTIHKRRRSCTCGIYEITLDEVEKLGNFIEIEQVIDDGDALSMQEKMFIFAKETFNLDRDNHVMRGYDIMMHYLEHK